MLICLTLFRTPEGRFVPRRVLPARSVSLGTQTFSLTLESIVP